ncbi:MAG: hypothetical protein WCH83_10505 [Alphaproteobacteria bacterium]
MRTLVLSTLAGLAALGAVAATPNDAKAQVAFSVGFGAPAPYYGSHYMPVHGPGWGHGGGWGGGGWGGGYRQGFYGGGDRYYGGPSCFVRRVWVETPWGPRPRPVRVCR